MEKKNVPASVAYFVGLLKSGTILEYDLRMGCISNLPSTATYDKWCIEVGEFYYADCPDYYYEIRKDRRTGSFQYREWKNYSQIWEDPKWSKWTVV